jgi:hypothetical protein
VKLKKIIQRRIRHERGDVKATGDVNAVISANVGEGSSHTHVSTRSRQRIVQRSGRTQVTHERTTGGTDDDEPAGGSRD